MRQTLLLALFLMLALGCGQKEPQVEKMMEDGVEVVLNQLEPYTRSGVKTSVILEEECMIDLEDPAVVEDHHVAGTEVLGQIAEQTMLDCAVCTRHDHQAGRVPRLDRTLGYELRRQVVVVVAEM